MPRFFARTIYFVLLWWIAGLTCLQSSGQSLNDIRKIWLNSPSGLHEHKGHLLSVSDFHQYARIRDDEFTAYLKEAWHDYPIYEGVQQEHRTTFIRNPLFNYPEPDIPPPVSLPFSSVTGSNHLYRTQKQPVPGIRKPEINPGATVNGSFRFYGQQINLNYDKLILTIKQGKLSEDSVSLFWESFSRCNSNHLISQLMDYRDRLGLGNWGYFRLVKAASGHIFKESRQNNDLLTWALMIRSGFDVRLAFNQSSSTVLFPCENTIYARQFVVIGQERFYLDREMKSQLLVTCRNPFPDNEARIDLKFYQSLNFKGETTVRNFLFAWNQKKFPFNLRLNPSVIRYYNDYPLTDPSVYFGAPVSSALKEDLLRQFQPVLSKMDHPEASAFLQQFVQREFVYAPSDVRNEKFRSCFSEQTIASKSGDDLGKAVLFSGLIDILLRLPVIGVHFPGYFSAAIGFDEPLEGDFYPLNRRKYVITDPTFMNAPIGVMIPEFLGSIPDLIDFSGGRLQQNRAREIWKQTLKLGAMQGGTVQGAVFDRENRALIAGYLTDKKTFSPFIASFSEKNTLNWIRKFEGDGKAIAFAITKVNEDEIYVAGTFNGNLEMDGIALQSGMNGTEMFFSQFNQNGKLVWMKSLAIDSTTERSATGFLVKFDRTGDNLSVQFSNEDERNIKAGFGAVNETGLCFTGSRNAIPGLVPDSWLDLKTNIGNLILRESDVLRSKKCDPKVAGFLALLKLLQKPGSEVTGNQLQGLINKQNPSFQFNHPSLFKAAGQLELIRNENGIVSIKTINSQSVNLNNLRIADGAQLILTRFDNGDILADVVSGIQQLIGKMELPINSFLMDCSSDSVVMDYDDDHTLKTIAAGTL